MSTMMIPATNISFGAAVYDGSFPARSALMGLIFLAVGLAVNGVDEQKRSLCTASTPKAWSAQCSQFGSTSLRAVYSFTIDGRALQYVSNYAGSNDLLVGQSVNGLLRSAAHRAGVYRRGRAADAAFPRVFTILGAVFLTVAARCGGSARRFISAFTPKNAEKCRANSRKNGRGANAVIFRTFCE